MTNTTTQVTAAVNNFYDRRLLMKAVPKFNYGLFAQTRDIPSNTAETIKFRRYTLFSAATTALTEGVTPTGTSLAITDATASPLSYGAFVTRSDFLTFTTQDPLLREINDLLGIQSGDTFDQLTRDVLAAGTTIQYASTATSRGTVTASMKLTRAEITEAVRTLDDNNAEMLTEIINPSTGFNSSPIAAGYIGFISPKTYYDLKDAPGFIPVREYASQQGVLQNEVGSIDEVRFLKSTNAKVFSAAGAGSIDVHGTIIIAKEAYGISRIGGQALQNIIKPLGSAGSADPLNQRATSGWKGTFVSKILNENFMIRIEHAVSS